MKASYQILAETQLYLSITESKLSQMLDAIKTTWPSKKLTGSDQKIK